MTATSHAPSLPLLLEIGAEELPSSFVDAALTALPRIVADELAKVRLSHGDVRALGTPRRLSVARAGRQPRGSSISTRRSSARQRPWRSRTASRPRRPRRSRRSSAPRSDASSIREAGGPEAEGRPVRRRAAASRRGARRSSCSAAASGACAPPSPSASRCGGRTLDATFGRPVQWIVALLGERDRAARRSRACDSGAHVARPPLPRPGALRREGTAGATSSSSASATSSSTARSACAR